MKYNMWKILIKYYGYDYDYVDAWECVNPYVVGCSRQLLLNKLFDPSTPSMRKVDDGEEKKKKKEKKENNDVYSGH